MSVQTLQSVSSPLVNEIYGYEKENVNLAVAIVNLRAASSLCDLSGRVLALITELLNMEMQGVLLRNRKCP